MVAQPILFFPIIENGLTKSKASNWQKDNSLIFRLGQMSKFWCRNVYLFFQPKRLLLPIIGSFLNKQTAIAFELIIIDLTKAITKISQGLDYYIFEANQT